jgi:2-polyprenyl-3-methyl-5-hydroxy-6-metoxy-1,4-benzoquinol methylase
MTAMKTVFCTVCLSDKRIVLKDARLNLYKCLACRHTITAHSTAKPEEIYSADYFSEEHKNWFQNPNTGLFRSIQRTIRKRLGQGELSILDIGCGNGDFLKFLQAADPKMRLFGVDRAPNVHQGITFFQQDFFDFPCTERFDAVINLTVIEHVEDVRRFIEKASSLTRPGGLLVTTTNNNNSLLYRVARIMNRVGLRAAYDRIYSSHHVNHFTNHSLKVLLEGGGLEVLSLKNHNYPLAAVDTPPAPYWIEQMHKAAVAGIFATSLLIGKGFLQTYVCRKKG